MSDSPRPARRTAPTTPDAGVSFGNSYIITDRNDPYTWLPDSTTDVAPPNELYFSAAPSAYDPSHEDYIYVTPDSGDFCRVCIGAAARARSAIRSEIINGGFR
jgi:hypothetical protein